MALSSSVQVLSVDRDTNERGKVSVTFTVRRTEDPRTYGHLLLCPEYTVDDLKEFPIAEAVVQAEGKGYASMYGWVQFV